MLSNRLHLLKADYDDCTKRLKDLDNDPTISKTGRIYQDRRAQLNARMKSIYTKMRLLGGDQKIIIVTGKEYLDNVLHSVTIKFSGISEDDAKGVFMLRHPASFNLTTHIEQCGKDIITPITKKQ